MRESNNVNGDWKFAFILKIVCSCALFIPMRALAANDPNTSASNNTYAVQVVKEEKGRESSVLPVFTLEIREKATDEVAHVTFGGIGQRIRSIEKLHLFENGKLVVHGKLKQADIIYVIDCEKHKVMDMFWCYDPVLSPSKRFWVYEKFYPYHGLRSIQTTVVLVYDMQRTPFENRVPVKGYTEWPKVQVGLPIYPRPYVEAKAYVLPRQQQEEPPWYLRSSPLLWSTDATDVVFLCNHEKVTYLVRVNVAAGIEKPKIFSAPVNVGSFVKSDLPGEFRKKESLRLHMFSAKEIRWDGNDHVVAKPNKAYYTLQDKIKLAVP